MNPLSLIPNKVRIVLYLVLALGAPLVGYLKAKGYIGDEELVLLGAYVTLLGGIAVSNTPTGTPTIVQGIPAVTDEHTTPAYVEVVEDKGPHLDSPEESWNKTDGSA